MKRSLRRVRGAVSMGLTWAVVWAPVAILVGTIIDPTDSMDEMWFLVGAYPGFLGGLVFSIVLGIAARRRRLDELSTARVGLWGALAGALVGSLPFVLGNPTTAIPTWLLAVVIVGALTLLCAASAAGSLALAQRAERRALLGAGAAVPNVTPRQAPRARTPA